MADVTAKAIGEVASFYSPKKGAEITSLKVHFSPKQSGEGDPSPDNVRPVEGWDGVTVRHVGKNIGRITRYSAWSTNSPTTGTPSLTNNYGTTLSTTTAYEPIVVTQTQYNTDDNKYHYRNGYFTIDFDTLEFDQNYIVSFRVTDIVNNPLEATLSDIRIAGPSGTSSSVSKIINNDRLVFAPLPFKRYLSSEAAKERKDIAIYVCGMSFTISDIMVTKADEQNQEYEPYNQNIISIDWSSESTYQKNLVDPQTNPIWSGSGIYTINDDGSVIVTGSDGRGWTSSQITPLSLPAGTYSFNWTGAQRVQFVTSDDAYDAGSVKVYTKPFTFTLAQHGGIKWKTTSDTYPITITVDINLVSAAHVYSGYIDLLTGELTSTYAKYTFSSLKDKNYLSYNDSYKGWWRALTAENIYGCVDSSDPSTQALSDIFKVSNRRANGIATDENYVIKTWGANTGADRTFFCLCSTLLPTDIDEFCTWLDEHQPSLYYQLLNPVTYHLTPHQISALLGHNNFFSNIDYIEVEYKYYEADELIKRKWMANQPHIETASGSVSKFQPSINSYLKDCIVTLNPIQKGENDPSPENIRPIDGYRGVHLWQAPQPFEIIPQTGETTSHEVNFSVDSDGLVTANGTPTSWAARNFGTIQVEGNEVLYMKIAGGLNNIVVTAPYLYDANGTKIDTSYDDNILQQGLDLSLYDGVKSVGLQIKRNTNNVYMDGTCYVALKNGSMPTINETFVRFRKNLFNENAVTFGKWTDSSGVITDNANGCISPKMEVKSGQKYTVWFNGDTPYSTSIIELDADGNFIKRSHKQWKQVSASNVIPYTITISNNTRYIYIQVATNPDTTTAENLAALKYQLEKGDTATSYEPYDEPIYGGYLDVTKGELVVTHKSVIYDGSESGWGQYKSSQQMHFYRTIPDKKVEMNSSISNMFPNANNIYFWDNEIYGVFGDHQSLHNLYFNAPYKMPGGVTEWREWLAEHPLQVVYKLDSPITYYLEPNQLSSLRGGNNIWSDADNVEVKYWTHGAIPKKKTVIWNQLAREFIEDYWDGGSKGAISFKDGIATVEWVEKYSSYYICARSKRGEYTSPAIGDVVYLSFFINPSIGNLKWGCETGNVQPAWGTSLPANTWTRLSFIIISKNEVSLAYLGTYRSAVSDDILGMTCQIKNAAIVNLTTMFGAGNEPTTTTEFENLCAINGVDLNQRQPHDEGTERTWIIN